VSQTVHSNYYVNLTKWIC